MLDIVNLEDPDLLLEWVLGICAPTLCVFMDFLSS